MDQLIVHKNKCPSVPVALYGTAVPSAIAPSRARNPPNVNLIFHDVNSRDSSPRGFWNLYPQHLTNASHWFFPVDIDVADVAYAP